MPQRGAVWRGCAGRRGWGGQGRRDVAERGFKRSGKCWSELLAVSRTTRWTGADYEDTVLVEKESAVNLTTN